MIKKYNWLSIFPIPVKDTDNQFEKEFFTTIERVPQHDHPYDLRDYITQYRVNGIKDMYGISIKEYLSLSSDEMEILNDLSGYINSKENEIVKNIVGEENESSDNT